MRVKYHIAWRTLVRRSAWGLAACVMGFLVLDRVFPLDTTVNYSPVVESRDGSVLHAYLAGDQQWRIGARLDEISPELKKAIVFKEDRHFYYHPGINLLAVGRAFVNNLFHLRRTSGASTITMQVVRMLHPRSRTYFHKCLEMFQSLQLELHHSKDEILQMYLNLVPYGSNINGVKTAALFYFSKTPDQLSLAELTALSVIPNRPRSLVIGHDNAGIMAERDKWLDRFRSAGIFSAVSIRDALREPMNAYRHRAPSGVPQLAFRLRKQQPAEGVIRSTIDAPSQQKAENIITNYMAVMKQHNINNAAMMMIDNATHEVLVYVGSSDFTDELHQGQVDGVRAVRSPGSALKPLLYGMCFDKGYATPHTVIADVPINIQGYSPENYDKTFNANVTAEYALSNSLNIPAVKLLSTLGIEPFSQQLERAGFASVRNEKKKIGLSMILGGCGVRLDEMSALYSSFANGGVYYPVSYVQQGEKKQAAVPATDLLSRPADYMLTKILCSLHRPDLPNARDEASGIPKIAWKTGTSYGRKDAWSIGYNKKYTIGVWIGNFSGQGVPELSGASVATPLLFELFNALDRQASSDWLEPPAEGLGFRLVCSVTGKLPDDSCSHQVMDEYIPGISPSQQCDERREVWLSANEKYCYCTSCLPPAGYKTKWLPNISSELAAYYESIHFPYAKLPPHNPACTRVLDGQSPRINSLTNGMTYIVADKGEQKMQLSCAAANDVQKVYWYVNDRFFAAAPAAQKVFFPATTPDIRITCTDDKGRSSHISIRLRFI